MYLYPRITLSTARSLVLQLADQPAETLRRNYADDDTLINPQLSFFAPTGGIRTDANDLRECRRAVRDLADQLGFPDAPSGTAAQTFDIESAIILYEKMRIAAAEASALEVWSHMTCIMMPDIVRWRYHGERSTQDRFIGSGRGVRKNTFGRLWWRVHLFHDEQNNRDPYTLLRALGEDDHVQITERPSIAGSDKLARQIAASLQETWEALNTEHEGVQFSERELLRDTMKRIRRRMSITAFDLLTPDILQDVVSEIFLASAQALQKSKTSI